MVLSRSEGKEGEGELAMLWQIFLSVYESPVEVEGLANYPSSIKHMQ